MLFQCRQTQIKIRNAERLDTVRCRAFSYDSEVREMKETTNNCRASRAHNPFDDGARERLRRMGLLTETGSIETSALTALAHAFAGLLFDDLCDACQDYSSVQAELQQLFDAADQAEPRQRFLLICLQYDRLSQVLPDPIWWISGAPEIAGVFADHFIRHLKKLNGSGEVVP